MGGRGRNERLEREMDGDSLFQELRDGHMTPMNHFSHFVYRHTLSSTNTIQNVNQYYWLPPKA